MITLSDYSENIEPNAEGIWICRNSRPISYPPHGNKDSLIIEQDSFWFQHRNHCLIELFKKFPPSGPVFDLGGGNGFVSLALREKGIATVVVEPGPEGAMNSQLRGLSPVVCATIEEAAFKTHSLPAVGLFDVLEHFENDRALLHTLHQLLRIDGRLYLTVPAYNFLWSEEDDYTGHYRRYTRANLTRSLEAAGFEVEFCSYFFRFLPLPIFLMRALPYRLGVARGRTLEANQKDHRPPPGIFSKIMKRFFAKETSLIRRSKSMWFGGSVMAVARPKRHFS